MVVTVLGSETLWAYPKTHMKSAEDAIKQARHWVVFIYSVLKNKVGITDQDQLDEYKGDFTSIRLLKLTQNPVEGSFDLAHLYFAIS
jgi:fido (protein-threonine AMPylation protein)